MKNAKQYLLTAIGCALAIGWLGLLTPRVAQTQGYSSPMRDVDNPARQPVSLQPNVVAILANAENGFARGIYTVPAGKRLIIDYIGCGASLPNGESALSISVTASSDAGITSSALAQFSNPPAYVDAGSTGFHAAIASQQVRMFGNPGDQISVAVNTNGGPTWGVLHWNRH